MTIDEAIYVLKQYIEYNDGIPNYYMIVEACRVAIDVMKPFEEGTKKATQELIKQGRDEAWEAGRKICCCGEKCLTSSELKDIFCTNYSSDIFLNNTASEAISKIKAYEEEQKKQKEESEFHIGDEVQNNDGIKGIVVGSFKTSDGSEFVSIMNADFKVPQIMPKEDYKKTGRYFPEILEVLKKLREDEKE